YAADLNGPNPGTDYDQVNVTGTVTLNNPTLALSGGFTPNPNLTVVLIANDAADPTPLGFNGLGEVAPVSVGAFSGFLRYAGNDGNDVILKVPGPVGVTGSSLTGNAFTVRVEGGYLKTLANGAVVDSTPLAVVTSYTVTGVDMAPDSLTIDILSGSPFTI